MQSLLIQQGDVLVKKIGINGVFKKEYKSIPSDAKPTKSNLVFKGETNSHALFEGDFELLEHEGVKFLKVNKTTVLDHVKDHNTRVRAEHHSQAIHPGDYFIDGVQEYDHLLEESRRVID